MKKICSKCWEEKDVSKFRFVQDGKVFGVAIIDRYDAVCGACRNKTAVTKARVSRELKKEKKQREKIYVYGRLV